MFSRSIYKSMNCFSSILDSVPLWCSPVLINRGFNSSPDWNDSTDVHLLFPPLIFTSRTFSVAVTLWEQLTKKNRLVHNCLLSGTFLLILQIIQDKHRMRGSAQTAHRFWVSIQMVWEMVSAWPQQMRIKGKMQEQHTEKSQWSPPAVSTVRNPQSVSVWMEFHESWMESQFTSWTSKGESHWVSSRGLLSYLIAGWFWARSLGKLCNRE